MVVQNLCSEYKHESVSHAKEQPSPTSFCLQQFDIVVIFNDYVKMVSLIAAETLAV